MAANQSNCSKNQAGLLTTTSGTIALGGQLYDYQTQLQYGLTKQEIIPMSGTKPIVICNGTTTEAKDQADAQAIAERLAHQHQADAYILRPIKKVAPKRDVVTTDME